MIEFPPVYMKMLPKVPGKLGLVTEENLVQQNLCLDVPPDNIKLPFRVPNTFGRKEIIYNLTTFFGHPVTNFENGNNNFKQRHTLYTEFFLWHATSGELGRTKVGCLVVTLKVPHVMKTQGV